jgi:hypothetical protein
MLSSDALGEETDAPFFFYSTDDAGKTWRMLVLRRPTFGMLDDYTFPAELFFSDAQHGWMLWRWAMMNSRLTYLLETTDGGHRWEVLPKPPLGKSLQFPSSVDGWMIGTSQRDRGIPTPENDAVWHTTDGGRHWDEISLPAPRDDLYFTGLKFTNRHEGVILGEARGVGDQNQGASFVWITLNGGRTWKLSKLRRRVETASIFGSQIIGSFHDPATHELRVWKGNQTITPNLPSGLPNEVRIGNPDFMGNTNAWLNVSSALLSTSDGGKLFRMILPSSGEPEWPLPQIVAAQFLVGWGLTVPQVCASRWRGALLDPDVQAGAQARCGSAQPAMVGPQRP